jgi:hypothetical protein
LSSQNENLGGVTMIPIIPKYKNFIKIYWLVVKFLHACRWAVGWTAWDYGCEFPKKAQRYVCMYVCMRGEPEIWPLHRDLQWSIGTQISHKPDNLCTNSQQYTV